MFDKIVKKNQVISEKRVFTPDEKDEDFTNIIFILNDNDIVYIGRTIKSIQSYLEEKFSKYHATHYYTEQVTTKDANNYLAELILKFQPINNKNIPQNNKYISNSMAKQDYFIDKRDFRKSFNEHGGIKYRNALYLKKQIFNDVYGLSEKYNQDMPKIGTYINMTIDAERIGLNVNLYNQEYSMFNDENGNKVEQITHLKSSAKEEYNKMLELQQLAYEVIQLLDSENFIAVNSSGEKKRLNANEHKHHLQADNNASSWLKAYSSYELDRLKSLYFEELVKEEK